MAGRALVIGTLGIGAAAALTGTGFAYDGGSNFGESGLGSSDVVSYAPTSDMSSFNDSSSNVSSTDSSFYGQGSDNTGSASFNSDEQMSYEAPQQVEPVEPLWGADAADVPVAPVEPLWGSDGSGVPEAPVGSPLEYQSLDVSGDGGPGSGYIAQLTGPDAPVEPLWGSDVPVGPSSNLMLPETSFRDTYRDHFIETYSVPEQPYSPEDMNVSFSGDPAVVAPLEFPAGSVPEANWGGFDNSGPVPAGSGQPVFYNTPGPAGTPDISSSEPTGVPASPLIMATAVPITTFLLPGYRGDVDASEPSVTDRSQSNWMDNLRTVDTDRGSRYFGQVVPRSDYASSVNDFQARDILGRSVSPNVRSTPYRDFVASAPTAPPTPVLPSGSSNLNGAGASGSNFGTSNMSLADTLQIRSGGPSSNGGFFRGSLPVGAAAPGLPSVDPVRPGVPLKSDFKVVTRYDTRSGQLFVGPEGAVAAEGSGQVPGTGLFWTGKLDASGRAGMSVGDGVSPVFQAKVTGDASLATGRNMTGFFGKVEGDANVNYANSKLGFDGNVTGWAGYGWAPGGNISGGYRISADEGNSGPVGQLNVPLRTGLGLQVDYSNTPDSGHRGVVQLAWNPFAKSDRAQAPDPQRGLAAPAPAVSTWSMPSGEVAVVQTAPTTVARSGTGAGALGGTSGLMAISGPNAGSAVSPVAVQAGDRFSSLPVASLAPSPAIVSSSFQAPVSSSDLGPTSFGVSNLGPGFLSSRSLGF